MADGAQHAILATVLADAAVLAALHFDEPIPETALIVGHAVVLFFQILDLLFLEVVDFLMKQAFQTVEAGRNLIFKTRDAAIQRGDLAHSKLPFPKVRRPGAAESRAALSRQYLNDTPIRAMLPGLKQLPAPRQTELVAFICQPAQVSITMLLE